MNSAHKALLLMAFNFTEFQKSQLQSKYIREQTSKIHRETKINDKRRLNTQMLNIYYSFICMNKV